MADGVDKNDSIHPRFVIIPKKVPIEGNHKFKRSDIRFRKNIPKAHAVAARALERDFEFPRMNPKPRSTVSLRVPEDHPGFKEGRLYFGSCQSCGKRNVNLKRVGNHLEVTKLVLCCVQKP